MSDQAATLRNSSIDKDFTLKSKKSICCLSIASGKGGVGKTFVTVNLAVAFAKLKKRVLLVDADLGLANADIVLGVSPEFTLQDVIFKGRSLDEVVVRTKYGVDLLCASSGSKEMVSLGEARIGIFIKELISFASNYDVLLFDCAAGIDSSVTSFIAATPQTLVVATAQPTSIMDVYALLKLINQDNLSDNISLVVNMADSDAQGKKVAETLCDVSNKYLSKPVDLLGILPRSKNADKAVHFRKPFVELYEEDEGSRIFKNMAKKILQRQSATTKLSNLNADKLMSGMLNL